MFSPGFYMVHCRYRKQYEGGLFWRAIYGKRKGSAMGNMVNLTVLRLKISPACSFSHRNIDFFNNILQLLRFGNGEASCWCSLLCTIFSEYSLFLGVTWSCIILIFSFVLFPLGCVQTLHSGVVAQEVDRQDQEDPLTKETSKEDPHCQAVGDHQDHPREDLKSN